MNSLPRSLDGARKAAVVRGFDIRRNYEPSIFARGESGITVCLRTHLVRISAASPIHNSNSKLRSNRSNQRECPLAPMPTRTATFRCLSS